jgi:hypothetical protein
MPERRERGERGERKHHGRGERGERKQRHQRINAGLTKEPPKPKAKENVKPTVSYPGTKSETKWAD